MDRQGLRLQTSFLCYGFLSILQNYPLLVIFLMTERADLYKVCLYVVCSHKPISVSKNTWGFCFSLSDIPRFV